MRALERVRVKSPMIQQPHMQSQPQFDDLEVDFDDDVIISV